jgi:hypothetical protein
VLTAQRSMGDHQSCSSWRLVSERQTIRSDDDRLPKVRSDRVANAPGSKEDVLRVVDAKIDVASIDSGNGMWAPIPEAQLAE